jgi:hypothetical protein
MEKVVFEGDVTADAPVELGWIGYGSAGHIAELAGLDPWGEPYEVMTLTDHWRGCRARSVVVVGQGKTVVLPPQRPVRLGG